MKQKIIVIVVAVLVFLSVAGAVGMYYLSDHNIKLDIDKDLAIYDTETEEVIGVAHFTLKGDINGSDGDGYYNESYSDLKLNIKGDILPEISYAENSLASFILKDKYIWVIISNITYEINDEGATIPRIDKYNIWVEIDRNNPDNFMVILGEKPDENEEYGSSRYVLVEAENTSEAKKAITYLSELAMDSSIKFQDEDGNVIY